jgi:hypothetical protein
LQPATRKPLTDAQAMPENEQKSMQRSWAPFRPSQIFVRSEIIDKFACACQAVIMMKTLGNFVLFIWSKLKPFQIVKAHLGRVGLKEKLFGQLKDEFIFSETN